MGKSASPRPAIPAASLANARGSAPLILTCDHASPYIPPEFANLGLPAGLALTHWGWDKGALSLSRFLSDALNAPLIHTNHSRLLLDANRPPASPGFIPLTAGTEPIPGNRHLSTLQRRERQERFFTPYHEALAAAVSRGIARRGLRLYLAVHSFAPVLSGTQRPWCFGVTYQTPSGLSRFMVEQLKAAGTGAVGINQPYPVTPGGDYGIYAHGEDQGLESVLLEVNQGLLASEEGIRDTGRLLSAVLAGYIKKGRPPAGETVL